MRDSNFQILFHHTRDRKTRETQIDEKCVTEKTSVTSRSFKNAAKISELRTS